MTLPPLSIRDALERDCAACLALDHRYETDTVWQMQRFPEDALRWEISFKTERLPRTLALAHLADERRMQAGLAADHCFLVAAARDSGSLLGYLIMRHEPLRAVGVITDCVIAPAMRRVGIGRRLVRVAATWAGEHRIQRLLFETQTQNYPAILFAQAVSFAFCGFNDRYLPQQDIAVYFGQAVR